MEKASRQKVKGRREIEGKRKKVFSQWNPKIIKKIQYAQKREGQPGLGGEAVIYQEYVLFLGIGKVYLGITKKEKKKGQIKGRETCEKKRPMNRKNYHYDSKKENENRIVTSDRDDN